MQLVFLRYARRCACLVAILSLFVGLGGCNVLRGRSAGQMRSQSLRTDAVVLPADYRVAVFTNDKIAGTSILLSDVPIEQVVSGEVRNAQIMHIELLWLPKAGETPMDQAATNTSIRHIVISNGQVGIYGGAGFARPSENPAEHDSVSFTLRDASLALQESTAGFVDLLSPSKLTGTFSARRDDKQARQLYFAVSQLVTNALGRTRYVMREAQTKPPVVPGARRSIATESVSP